MLCMSQTIKDYFERFCHYHYMGYLRHYYNAARHPHPKRFIVFIIAAASLMLTLVVFSTIAIINDEFQGSPVVFYSLTLIMYLIWIAIMPTIILWIQGYRHRDNIKASDVPDNLPKNSGNEVWYILFFVILILVIRKILE
jgi:hypothetical protein